MDRGVEGVVSNAVEEEEEEEKPAAEEEEGDDDKGEVGDVEIVGAYTDVDLDAFQGVLSPRAGDARIFPCAGPLVSSYPSSSSQLASISESLHVVFPSPSPSSEKDDATLFFFFLLFSPALKSPTPSSNLCVSQNLTQVDFALVFGFVLLSKPLPVLIPAVGGLMRIEVGGGRDDLVDFADFAIFDNDDDADAGADVGDDSETLTGGGACRLRMDRERAMPFSTISSSSPS